MRTTLCHKIALLLILFHSSIIHTFAQDSTQHEISNYPKNRILFSPISLFDPINPSFQIGYERVVSDFYSVQLEAGYITTRSIWGYIFINTLGFNETHWYTFSGYKLRGELKCYLSSLKTNQNRTYVSSEVYYIKNFSYVNDIFNVLDTTFQYEIDRPEGANAYEDFYYVDKIKIGVNIKTGSFFKLSSDFSLESIIGIGLYYRYSTHLERENPNDSFYDPVTSYSNKSGRRWMINIPMSLKLTYSF